MDTILTQRFLKESDADVTLITLLLVLLIMFLALPRLKLRWGGILTAGLFAGYLAVTFIMFDRGYILNVFYPLLLLPLLYIVAVLCRVVAVQSDKIFIKDLFGRYVSPQVAKEILTLADSEQLKLGGEQREVTVLFADIRNYIKISEQLSPESVVNMLNTYLSAVIDAVLQNGGMVNKFAGDNIMAVWNAPQPQPGHARLAVKAAWEAQRKITTLHKVQPDLPQVQFGIGINSGNALAGNVGSSGRTEYTVIGDTVNLASRICSATPGGEIWIGPETYNTARDYLQVEVLEPQVFKGKIQTVAVFRVTGLT